MTDSLTETQVSKLTGGRLPTMPLLHKALAVALEEWLQASLRPSQLDHVCWVLTPDTAPTTALSWGLMGGGQRGVDYLVAVVFPEPGYHRGVVDPLQAAQQVMCSRRFIHKGQGGPPPHPPPTEVVPRRKKKSNKKRSSVPQEVTEEKECGTMSAVCGL